MTKWQSGKAFHSVPLIIFAAILSFFSIVLRVSAEEAENLEKISSVVVCPENVFDLSDPTQRNVLFILANKLHITTRPYFIKRQLLMRKGDIYDPFLLDETERLLREYKFLRLVSIEKAGDNSLKVYTRDAWSTMPEISYGTEGGKETWAVGLKEKNLLGLGKTVAAYYRKELDRTYKEFYYEDPLFIYPRWKLGLNYQQDGDKKNHIYRISRPFYSSVTPWEVFLGEDHTRHSIKLYADGDDYAGWLRDRKEIMAGGGISIGSNTHHIKRLRASYYMREETFDQEFNYIPVIPARDKKMHAVVFSVEHALQDFYKTQYVNTFDREEDFNMGNELFIRYGYSPEKWDSDMNRHLVKISEQKGFKFGNTAFFVHMSGEGRIEHKKAQNMINFYHIYHYTKFTQRQTLVTSLNFEHGINMDSQEQLLLGGASGLRGYSVKQFTGNKKLLFNIEYRSFWIDDFLRLVSIGGILFFDSGYIWQDGRQVDLKDLRSNIGFGLRVDPTRGRGANPFNISLAYALNKNHEDTRWVLTISGRPDLLNTIGPPDEKEAGARKFY